MRPRINYRNTQQLLSVLFYPGLFWLLLPLASVFVMQRLGRVDSVFLENRRQRTAVYAIASLWAGCLLLLPSASYLENRWKVSVFFVLLGLGLVNAFRHKISAHGAGVAGFLALSLHLYLNLGESWTVPTSAAAVCALIYWARLRLSAQSHFELLTGFCLGFFTTFVLILWT